MLALKGYKSGCKSVHLAPMHSTLARDRMYIECTKSKLSKVVRQRLNDHYIAARYVCSTYLC